MKKFFILSCLVGVLFAKPVFSQIYYNTFSATKVGGSWAGVQPVGAAYSKDGTKLFVWLKEGKIYVCNKSGNLYNRQANPVIDLTNEVGDWGDHGLLGFALDPDFDNNGLIYLLYVVDRNFLLNKPLLPVDNFNATIGRITRYKVITSGSDLVADLATRTILLGETKETGIPMLYDSHGVGSLVFASDGSLLASAGDGASYDGTDTGSYNIGGKNTYHVQALADHIIRPEENVGALRAQMINSHNGKLLRINPANGDGLPSNPFYDVSNPRAPRSRVWAMGLRNPFRFTIKPGTGSTNQDAGDIGEIYVGDVGWDKYEEMNVINGAGINCGWPIFEGVTPLYKAAITNATSYAGLVVGNRDEPNPLAGPGCPAYYSFQSMIKQATADDDKTVHNQCNSSVVIGTGNRFVDHRPSLDWKHAVDSARVPTFTGNNATFAQIGSAASGIAHIPFPGNCSIGGVWYTGTAFPAAFQNRYYFADLGAQWLKAATVQFTDVVTKLDDVADAFPNITYLTQNPIDGTLLAVDLGNFVNIGPSVQVIKYGGNQPPVAKINVDKTFGASPLTVNFTTTGSSDPDGTISTYAWNFGNGTGTGPSPTRVFTAAGPTKFIVRLTVTDNQGGTATDSVIISANNTPPVVNITSPVKNSLYTLGADTTYACTATVTDAEQGFGDLKYEWQTFLRHNNHQHPEPIDTVRNTTTNISRIGCNTDFYYWIVKLTVTDVAGLSTTDSSKIFPDCLATLNGAIILPGRPAPPDLRWKVPVLVNIYDPGNTVTPVITTTVVTDTIGNFYVPGIAPGVYTIAIKNGQSLQVVRASQLLSTGVVSLDFGTLKMGDINGDNFITLLDLGQLTSSYNKGVGDPEYVPLADLNGDGFVTVLDLGILIQNYNTSGETP
jgi:glucose/arabinose dehydrogenase/PKD repeat protein